MLGKLHLRVAGHGTGSLGSMALSCQNTRNACIMLLGTVFEFWVVLCGAKRVRLSDPCGSLPTWGYRGILSK